MRFMRLDIGNCLIFMSLSESVGQCFFKVLYFIKVCTLLTGRNLRYTATLLNQPPHINVVL